jgi:hypothetical protein
MARARRHYKVVVCVFLLCSLQCWSQSRDNSASDREAFIFYVVVRASDDPVTLDEKQATVAFGKALDVFEQEYDDAARHLPEPAPTEDVSNFIMKSYVKFENALKDQSLFGLMNYVEKVSAHILHADTNNTLDQDDREYRYFVRFIDPTKSPELREGVGVFSMSSPTLSWKAITSNLIKRLNHTRNNLFISPFAKSVPSPGILRLLTYPTFSVRPEDNESEKSKLARSAERDMAILKVQTMFMAGDEPGQIVAKTIGKFARFPRGYYLYQFTVRDVPQQATRTPEIHDPELEPAPDQEKEKARSFYGSSVLAHGEGASTHGFINLVDPDATTISCGLGICESD